MMKRLLIAAAGTALGVALVSASTTTPAQAFAGEVFEIVGGGRQTHFEVQPLAGKAGFVNTLKATDIAGAIVGTAPGSGPFLEHDAGGKAYILFDSLTAWRISTNTNGTNALTLNGLVDGAGKFMFAGTHALSGSRVVITGKVKFAKNTYTPLAISGKIVGVSNVTNHFVSGTFKTLGKAK